MYFQLIYICDEIERVTINRELVKSGSIDPTVN